MRTVDNNYENKVVFLYITSIISIVIRKKNAVKNEKILKKTSTVTILSQYDSVIRNFNVILLLKLIQKCWFSSQTLIFYNITSKCHCQYKWTTELKMCYDVVSFLISILSNVFQCQWWHNLQSVSANKLLRMCSVCVEMCKVRLRPEIS